MPKGVAPSVNISHMVTPNAHTSLLKENVCDDDATSGANQRTGRVDGRWKGLRAIALTLHVRCELMRMLELCIDIYVC